MAELERKVEIERKIETVVTETHEITLTLDLDEAEFLHDVMRTIGGSPNSRRRHADEISDLLEETEWIIVRLLYIISATIRGT